MREIINVTDKYGFIHHVNVNHSPAVGISIAYYDGNMIASVEYGNLHEPATDNDGEWERYEEELQAWKETAETNLIPKCEEYFNR